MDDRTGKGFTQRYLSLLYSHDTSRERIAAPSLHSHGHEGSGDRSWRVSDRQVSSPPPTGDNSLAWLHHSTYTAVHTEKRMYRGRTWISKRAAMRLRVSRLVTIQQGFGSIRPARFLRSSRFNRCQAAGRHALPSPARTCRCEALLTADPTKKVLSSSMYKHTVLTCGGGEKGPTAAPGDTR